MPSDCAAGLVLVAEAEEDGALGSVPRVLKKGALKGNTIYFIQELSIVFSCQSCFVDEYEIFLLKTLLNLCDHDVANEVCETGNISSKCSKHDNKLRKKPLTAVFPPVDIGGGV